MAQSSCEAEMIALMDLANYTISMLFLLDELLQKEPLGFLLETMWPPSRSMVGLPCTGGPVI